MLSFIVLFAIFAIVSADSNPDEIVNLPGLTYKINFRHYSGYLNATNDKFLHYWFVESQKDPANDPLVLWMNGGPGCSSLDGLLTELGPFHVKPDGKTLYDNPFSWNKVANVIFLEAPAGVGYSYSNSGEYATNDDIVSLDNYNALQHFFVKFPQFKKNDFYITGESYGGIYIPTLSVRVLTGPASINFKGFAIGNGFLDVNKLANSLMFFWYNHGLLGDSLWLPLVVNCCSGCLNNLSCDFTSSSEKCLKAVENANAFVGSANINVYNIYSTCAPSSSSSSRLIKSREQMDSKNLFQVFPFSNKLQENPPCIDSSNISAWLNQKSVRNALHIPSFLPPWDICSDAVATQYRRLYNTMKPQILKLVNSGKLRGLIYNGDVDMACNFLGDEWFFDGLQLKLVADYQPWTFNKQTAGFVKSFQNLTYMTVKGSGHMVPQDKPGPAFKMISSFLYQKPY